MKKGFTLVEIILSIGLVVLIGTVSIFSFNLIKKNNKTKTLESMSDTILTAVNLYVETNSDVKEQLYNNKNGLKIPLTTLEIAGLVDFEDIELDEEDFVVTMLGSTDPNDDTCANTYTAKSWNITSGETIYICEKRDGTSNFMTIGGIADNLGKITKERHYYKDGTKGNAVLTDNHYSQIVYIDLDDSIVLTTRMKVDLKDGIDYTTVGKYIVYKDYYHYNYQKYNSSGLSTAWSSIITPKYIFGIDEKYIQPINVVANVSYTYNGTYNGTLDMCYDRKEGSCTAYSNRSSVPSETNHIQKGTRTLALLTKEDVINASLYSTPEADSFKSKYCVSNNGNCNYYFKVKLKPCVKLSNANGTIDDPYTLNFSKC